MTSSTVRPTELLKMYVADAVVWDQYGPDPVMDSWRRA